MLPWDANIKWGVLRYISTLQRRQRRSIACSYAVDEDPDLFCFKKCTSKIMIHKDNTRTEQEAIT